MNGPTDVDIAGISRDRGSVFITRHTIKLKRTKNSTIEQLLLMVKTLQTPNPFLNFPTVVCHSVSRTEEFKASNHRISTTTKPKLFSEKLICSMTTTADRSNSSQDHHDTLSIGQDLDEVYSVCIPQGYWDDLFDNALSALNTVPLDGDQYVRKKLH